MDVLLIFLYFYSSLILYIKKQTNKQKTGRSWYICYRLCRLPFTYEEKVEYWHFCNNSVYLKDITRSYYVPAAC